MLFDELRKINERPEPFEFYNADDLWTDKHRAKQMLAYHLDGTSDYSSRKTDFIRKSVDWIVEHFDIRKGKSVIDFGCGPGLYTTPLAETGASVTGIDFSASSLEYAGKTASEKGLDINYLNMNYLDFKSDRKFDLVLLIMCDFCSLSPKQRSTLMNIFRESLADDGRILLDVYQLAAFDKRTEASSYAFNLLDGFWSPDDYFGFLNTFKYENDNLVLDKWSIFEKEKNFTVYNWHQHFSIEALKAELESNGLSLIESFSDVAGTGYGTESDQFAIVAGKA